MAAEKPATAESTSTTGQDRVFIRDTKPYAMPDRLEDLQGPASGIVTIPKSIFWAPGDNTFNLDDAGASIVYRAALAEGTVADQTKYVNRERLIELWPQLMLPKRVWDMWEDRFPELTHTPPSW